MTTKSTPKSAPKKAAAPKAAKAEKPSKAAAPEAKSAAAVAETVVAVNGVSLDFGNVKQGGTAKAGLLTYLPRGSIKVQKGFNPRQQFNGISELAASIKRDGIMSSLVVRPVPGKDGEFYLVAGERRLRAADEIGLEKIPVSIRTDLTEDEAGAKAAAVAENAEDGRSNLNPIELGRVFKELESTHGWTVQKIASETNTHSAKVRRALTLLEAPTDVQNDVAAGKISAASGLEIAKLDDATRAALKDKLSTDHSAAEIRKMAKDAGKQLADPAEVNDGKSAKKKTGSARAASLTAWKGSKEKTRLLGELCSALANATEADKGESDYFELRGAVAALLWDRGDIDSAMLPNAASTVAKDVKALKVFDSLVAAEAKKHKPEGAKAEAAGNGAAD